MLKLSGFTIFPLTINLYWQCVKCCGSQTLSGLSSATSILESYFYFLVEKEVQQSTVKHHNVQFVSQNKLWCGVYQPCISEYLNAVALIQRKSCTQRRHCLWLVAHMVIIVADVALGSRWVLGVHSSYFAIYSMAWW